MIIDATNMIAGRIATVAAKKALLCEEVIIINSEKAVLTGTKAWLLSRFQQKRNHGAALVGPYFPKKSERIMKRIIRGMLPYKESKGREAFARVKCYIGVPAEYEGKETQTIQGASVSKLPNTKYVELGELSKLIGAKQ